MFRPILNLRSAISFQTHSFVIPSRCTSITTNAINFENEWDAALPFDALPGPGGFEMLRKFSPGGRYHNCSFPDIHKRMHEDYGSIFRMKGLHGYSDMVMSFNPEDYEKLFRNEGPWPIRRPMESLTYYRQKVRPQHFQGLGLVTEQGEKWQQFRMIVNPVLMQPKTIKLYVTKLDEVTKEFVQIMKNIRNEQNELPANFYERINRWTLEMLGVVAFDTRLGVLDEKSPGSHKAIKLINDLFVLFYELEVRPSMWRYFTTPTLRKLIKTLDEIHDFVLAKVEDAIARLEQNPTSSDDQSVLEKLIEKNKDVAIIMAHDMLVAGVDTTSVATIGTLYLLAKNPEKQGILREELRKILPNKDSPLTPENMRNLPYLRACIKEGLRFYPPISGFTRTTFKDIVLQGFRIPKGIDVFIAPMPMQQDSRYFVQGDEFIPERWLKGHNFPVAPEATPFVYLPFGFGPRACVGKRLANLEMEIIISRITRQFEYRWNYDDLRIRPSIISVPENELKFEMVDLKD